MTQLSPETQAVLGAVDALYEEDIPHDYRIMAAAIRELLEQVWPEHRPHYPLTLDERYRKVSVSEIRDRVLAIVAQLEAL